MGRWQVMRSLVIVAVMLAAAGQVQGEIVTFTDRFEWESAAGAVTNYDFDSQPTGVFGYRDFGDFTASPSPSTLVGVVDGSWPGSIDGTNHLFLTTFSTQSPLTLTFDSPISAFGFDWRTTSFLTNDGFDLAVNGSLLTVSPGAPASGFFGLIKTEDGSFTEIMLQDDEDGFGLNFGIGLDNVSYGTGAHPNPEPTTLAIWGTLGGLGLIAARRRRKVA